MTLYHQALCKYTNYNININVQWMEHYHVHNHMGTFDHERA